MKAQRYECPTCGGALGTTRFADWVKLRITKLPCPKCGMVEPVLRVELVGAARREQEDGGG